jgi:uncharacterized protein YjdB
MEGLMRRAACFLLLIFTCSCTPEPKSLTVDPESEAIAKKGGSVSFRALVKDAKGQRLFDTKVKPTWASGTPEVASVDQTGRVTALKSGESVISATLGALKSEGKVKVSIPATLTLTPPTLEFKEPGQIASIEAKVADDAGNALPGKAPDWDSSDPKVARVVGGRVSAMAPGKATITATLDTVKATAEVVVKSVDVPVFAKLTVKPATVKLKKGETATLTAAAVDKKGKSVGEVPLVWISSNDKIATVQEGTVTGVKKGAAKIIVGVKGVDKKSATVKVTVK